MKPRPTAVRKNAPMPPKELLDTPGSVLVRLSQGNHELPAGTHARFMAMTEATKDKVPDVALVSDLLKMKDSRYGLIAWLFGARFVDLRLLYTKGRLGKCVAFHPAISTRRIFYVTKEFREKYPMHCEALRIASNHSGNAVLANGKM